MIINLFFNRPFAKEWLLEEDLVKYFLTEREREREREYEYIKAKHSEF